MFTTNDLQDRQGQMSLEIQSPISYIFDTETLRTKIKDLINSMSSGLW